MVDVKKYNDQVITHKVLNYINGALQGLYAFNNILSQLKSASFKPENIEENKMLIEKNNAWLNKLWDGEPMFIESNGRMQSAEAEEARELLKALVENTKDVADLAASIYQNKNFSHDKESVFCLVALSGRNIYSRDAYARGFLDFARIFNDSKMADSWRTFLEPNKNAITRLSQIITILQKEMPTNETFYHALLFENRLLPNIFSAQVHDMYQLLNVGYGQFTYAAAKFETSEARLWERTDINAVEAGYWRAYSFDPEECLAWKKQGFIDPLIAAEWKSVGLSPIKSAEWINGKIAPLMAMTWDHAGYLPSEAIPLIQSGQTEPPSKKQDY